MDRDIEDKTKVKYIYYIKSENLVAAGLLEVRATSDIY